MSHNLKVVSRNFHPTRDEYQPAVWLVYSRGESAIEVHMSDEGTTETRTATEPEWIPLEALDLSHTW